MENTTSPAQSAERDAIARQIMSWAAEQSGNNPAFTDEDYADETAMEIKWELGQGEESFRGVLSYLYDKTGGNEAFRSDAYGLWELRSILGLPFMTEEDIEELLQGRP